MKFTSSKKMVIYALMAVAFALWVYLFRDFVLLRASMFDDGKSYYYINYHYWENLLRGVFPLWYPFKNWGMPYDLNLRFIGEFNPFLLIPIILWKLGVAYSLTYFIYAYSYYFLGALGFYLLAKRIFLDRLLAFMAFLLFLFSSLGINIFFNYCEIVISVCSIWFFYFLVSFFQEKDKRSFLGITALSMIILTTYIPFYFLTVFLLFLVFYGLFYPQKFVSQVRELCQFIVSHKWFSIICLGGIILSAFPGLIWYVSAKSGDFTVNYRQVGTAANNAALVGKSVVSAGGLIGPVTFNRLFTGLTHQVNQLSYFFLSVFWVIIILLSLVNRITRIMAVFFFVGLSTLLISLTYVAGVHSFLYDHIFYFRTMRNMYYLLQLGLPFIILFVVSQFDSFVQKRPSSWRGKMALFIFMAAMHGVFIVFLNQLGGIITATYCTVIGSFLFFTLIISGAIKKDNVIVPLILFVLITIQPIEVFRSYVSHAGTEPRTIVKGLRRRPVFEYTRKRYGEERVVAKGVYGEASGMREKNFRKYLGSPWAEKLLRKVNNQVLQEYVRNKLIVYDRVQRLDDEDIDWNQVTQHFFSQRNTALVANEDADGPASSMRRLPAVYQVVSEKTNELSVEKFDINQVIFNTRFKERKFLVYNDTYHAFWRVYVNGKKAKLYRANIAFKGVWLNPGDNRVVFQYGASWHYFLIGILFVSFYGIFGYLLWLYVIPYLQKVIGKRNYA